ncbi:MAG: hypothetical protein WCF33_05050 [Pseudonocardiaceae bacterium]
MRSTARGCASIPSTVDAALAKHAQRAFTAAGYDAVTVLTGEGTVGHRERAPYDRVFPPPATPKDGGGKHSGGSGSTSNKPDESDEDKK